MIKTNIIIDLAKNISLGVSSTVPLSVWVGKDKMIRATIIGSKKAKNTIRFGNYDISRKKHINIAVKMKIIIVRVPEPMPSTKSVVSVLAS